MDAYLYLTSVQAVSVLRPHNMPNGGSSYFHYQKNYLEYSLKIYEKQHDGVFLLFSEGVRGRDWGHFRTFSKTDIYFKITFSLHSFFNNRLAEMVLLPMNHHFYMQFFCCFCFFEKNLVVRRFDFEDFSLFFFFFFPHDKWNSQSWLVKTMGWLSGAGRWQHASCHWDEDTACPGTLSGQRQRAALEQNTTKLCAVK